MTRLLPSFRLLSWLDLSITFLNADWMNAINAHPTLTTVATSSNLRACPNTVLTKVLMYPQEVRLEGVLENLKYNISRGARLMRLKIFGSK